MGTSISKSSNFLLSATNGGLNLAKSSIEYASQKQVNLLNSSPHRTSALAFASLLVYGSDGDDFPGYTVQKKLDYANREFDLHALFVTKNLSKDAILAIRGTASMKNMYTDLLLMHHTVEAQTMSILKDFLNSVKVDYNITCTGHSLGGFLASVLAAELQLPCITFCSPRMFLESIFTRWEIGC